MFDIGLPPVQAMATARTDRIHEAHAAPSPSPEDSHSKRCHSLGKIGSVINEIYFLCFVADIFVYIYFTLTSSVHL